MRAGGRLFGLFGRSPPLMQSLTNSSPWPLRSGGSSGKGAMMFSTDTDTLVGKSKIAFSILVLLWLFYYSGRPHRECLLVSEEHRPPFLTVRF